MAAVRKIRLGLISSRPNRFIETEGVCFVKPKTPGIIALLKNSAEKEINSAILSDGPLLAFDEAFILPVPLGMTNRTQSVLRTLPGV